MFSTFNFLLRNLRLPASVAAVLLISLTVAGTGLAQIEFGTISGTVVDENTGRPLTGTNIILVDTRLGASTDRDGNFEILRVPPGNYTLEIGFIGYATQNVDVSVSADRTAVVNIEMETDILNLDEIIVTGAGTEIRAKEMGTVTQRISSQDIENTPVESIEQLLAGRIAGGNVMMKNGQPGTGASISLRGVTSGRADQTPQIYIDGVRMETAQGVGSGLGGVAPSSLADIHIDDIDHIEIVKPGAGTTLYGSEAASGIIQIFTKRGRAGTPRWNIRIEQGWDQPSTRFLYDKGIEYEPGKFTYENLMRDHVLQDGHYEKYSINVSGGNEAITYNISGAVKDAQGIMRNNASTYYSFNTGIRAFISDKLQIDVTARSSRDRIQRNQSNNSIPGIMVALEVLDWPFSRPDSEVSLKDKIDRLNIYFLQENINVTYRYNFSTTTTYDYNDYWSNKLTLGIDYRKSEQRLFAPIPTDAITTSRLSRQDRENMTFTFDYRATIKYPVFNFLSSAFSFFDDDDITSSFTVGGRGFRRNARRISASGSEFGLPGTDDFDNAGIIDAFEINSEIFNGTILFNEQLGLWDKLFLTGSFTIDGNTSFGTSGDRDAIETVNYASGSVAYNVSDEGLWERLPFALGTYYINPMKLRFAYGETGAFPGTFTRDKTFSQSSFRGEVAADFGQPGNADIKPERTTTQEYGFDTAIFNGRAGLEYTYWRQKTEDALFSLPNDPSTAQGSVNTNVGELKNWGHEITLDVTAFRSRNVNVSFNLGYNTVESEVVSLGGRSPFGSGPRWEEGRSIGVIRRRGPTFDANGEIDGDNEQKYIRGPANQFFSAGLNISIGQDLDLSIFGDGQKGGNVYNLGNLFRFFANAEFPPSDAAFLNGVVPDGYSSSRARIVFYETSDYFNIRQLSATYRIPRSIFGSKISTVFSIRNVWKFAHNDFIDPELNGFNSSGVLGIAQASAAVLSPAREWRLSFSFGF